MGYEEIMRMPIRAFWVFGRNIDRIDAQRRLGDLQVANSAQSGEAAQELGQQLVLELGEVLEPDVIAEPLDRAGLDNLRAMM
jgi:hypothetical protein